MLKKFLKMQKSHTHIEFIEAIKPLMEKDRFMAHLSKPSRLGAYVERVNQMLVG
jgi:hypothetical protein